MSTPIVVTHPCALFHNGLRQTISKGHFRPVRFSTTLSDGLEDYLRSLKSVVWLVGVGSCGPTTYDLIQRVVTTTPGVKPVILAASLSPDDIPGALKAGVRGVFYQDMPGERLVKALELIALSEVVVHQGQLALGQTQTNADLEGNNDALEKVGASYQTTHSNLPDSHTLRDASLSRLETLILRMLVEGASNKTIALNLVITESTVKVHMKALLRKLRVQNRTQAAIWAHDHISGKLSGVAD